jgi:hypothetical protein
MTNWIKGAIKPSDIATFNNGLHTERYNGALLVFTPPLKWKDLGVKYTGELERILRPAIDFEEEAILVAPDRFTHMMLKLESFPARIPVVLGEKEARRRAEELASQADSSVS